MRYEIFEIINPCLMIYGKLKCLLILSSYLSFKKQNRCLNLVNSLISNFLQIFLFALFCKSYQKLFKH